LTTQYNDETTGLTIRQRLSVSWDDVT